MKKLNMSWFISIGLASVLDVRLAIAVFSASGLILSIFSIQDPIILLFTTGLLGHVMGTLLYRKGISHFHLFI